MKKRKRGIAISLTLLVSSLIIMLTLFTGCEERKGDQPEITVSFSRQNLYPDGVDCDLNFTEITFFLTGSPSFIQNEKIRVEYSKGTFVGALSGGDANHVVTNKDGIAKGVFRASENATGIVEFRARMGRFRDVEDITPLYLFEIPSIELDVVDNIIAKNSAVGITVEISDTANNIRNISDQRIEFSSNFGSFDNDAVRTDDNGRAANTFFPGDRTGTATIRAALGICKNQHKEKKITVVETLDEPILDVELQRRRLYYDADLCGLNRTDVHFQLEGDYDYIADAKLNVTYNTAAGSFDSDGNTTHAITGSDGYVRGVFTAKAGYIGQTSLTVTHDAFPNVTETVNLYIYDLPQIDLSAESYNIGSQDSTKITVQLSDQADDIDNKTIKFSASGGLLDYESVVTDENGKAVNLFHADGTTGPVKVHAYLDFCTNRRESITIYVE